MLGSLPMAKKKYNIDRGNLLRTIVEENGIPISKLMKKIGYKDRASYYAHISKPDLSFEILNNYARALNYDLRQDIPEISNFMAEDPEMEYYMDPESLEEAIVLLGKLRIKFSQLMEKHLKLIEENNRLLNS